MRIEFEIAKRNSEHLFIRLFSKCFGSTDPEEAHYGKLLQFFRAVQSKDRRFLEFCQIYESREIWSDETLPPISNKSLRDRMLIDVGILSVMTIRKWSIHEADKLVSIFPESVPEQYRAMPMITILTRIDWMLHFYRKGNSVHRDLIFIP